MKALRGECPTCGARLPSVTTATVVCSHCGEEVAAKKERVGSGEAQPGAQQFPNFAKKPIPCPSCDKKGLRPRSRTNDFRCQHCGSIFTAEEIENLASPPSPESQERQHVITTALRLFPPDIAGDLILARLHPDDMREVVSIYTSISRQTPTTEQMKELIDDLGGHFETDPNKVKPPTKGKDKDGKVVPFETLGPQEQAAAIRQHRNMTLAVSLAHERQLAPSTFPPLPAARAAVPTSSAAPSTTESAPRTGCVLVVILLVLLAVVGLGLVLRR